MERTMIALVVDRSGSMISKKSASIEGFNKFISEQQALPGEGQIYTVFFDHEYSVIHDFVNLHDVKFITEADYIPRGMTALYDAIGKTMATVGDKVDELNKAGEKPDSVIFAILTDGQENDSKNMTKEDINKLIDHWSKEQDWKFIFLAADKKAMVDAEDIGIVRAGGVTMDFMDSSKGVETAYRSFSSFSASARGYSEDAYTEAKIKAEEKLKDFKEGESK